MPQRPDCDRYVVEDTKPGALGAERMMRSTGQSSAATILQRIMGGRHR
jgi:hypothetical protein